ncbi:hypothetical protein C2G38_2271634 [Gigaspora rosea]|uniref:Uncharacterized protein n=1 Tax=Gigaspora rosea TaxID=44941 RepID=A0A397VTW6_9GLOM|nr:hypothetical protein C2G38_2271634 [Gigaspora rosea]
MDLIKKLNERLDSSSNQKQYQSSYTSTAHQEFYDNRDTAQYSNSYQSIRSIITQDEPNVTTKNQHITLGHNYKMEMPSSQYLNKQSNNSPKDQDIAEWLLAFKSYAEAALIIYDLREQELNTYRDHINTLCIKQEFSAVLAYDKDRRLNLTTNCDTTLLDQSIEAEGNNFDVMTTKRSRLISNPRTSRPNLYGTTEGKSILTGTGAGVSKRTTAKERMPT